MPRHDLFDLEGEVAVVTGGAGHLGSAICSGLADYGAAVFIACRGMSSTQHIERLVSSYPLKIQHIPCDVHSRGSIDKAFERIFNMNGKIDILVNNAYSGGPGKLDDMTESNWLAGIEGTINHVFRCTQAVMPYMKECHYGSIINISSMYGSVSPDPSMYGESGFDNPPNYGAGKAAIIQFTRYAACHLSPFGIRVNSISPGPFPNETVQENVSFISKLNEKVPLKRFGKPEELKGAVILLASNAASYITGANIPVDGGWTAW